MHDSWINSYFSASERSITMRFSIFCAPILLHSQTLKEVCNFNDKNPKRKSRTQKIPLFKVANPPLYNFHAEKRDSKNWSKKAFIFLPNDWSTFWSLKPGSHFKRYPRPGHFAGHKCDEKRLNVQPPQSRARLYHFFNSEVQA